MGPTSPPFQESPGQGEASQRDDSTSGTEQGWFRWAGRESMCVGALECVLPASGDTGRLGWSPETSAASQLWTRCPAPRLLLRKETPASALLTPTCSPFSTRPSLSLKGKPDDPQAPHGHRSLCLSPCRWPRPPSNLTAPRPALPASLLATRPCAALQGPRGLGASHFCSLSHLLREALPEPSSNSPREPGSLLVLWSPS